VKLTFMPAHSPSSFDVPLITFHICGVAFGQKVFREVLYENQRLRYFTNLLN